MIIIFPHIILFSTGLRHQERVGATEHPAAHLDSQARGCERGSLFVFYLFTFYIFELIMFNSIRTSTPLSTSHCPTTGRSTWLSSTSTSKASSSSKRVFLFLHVRPWIFLNPRRRLKNRYFILYYRKSLSHHSHFITVLFCFECCFAFGETYLGGPKIYSFFFLLFHL